MLSGHNPPSFRVFCCVVTDVPQGCPFPITSYLSSHFQVFLKRSSASFRNAPGLPPHLLWDHLLPGCSCGSRGLLGMLLTGSKATVRCLGALAWDGSQPSLYALVRWGWVSRAAPWRGRGSRRLFQATRRRRSRITALPGVSKEGLLRLQLR